MSRRHHRTDDKRYPPRGASKPKPITKAETEPDWTRQCENCGATPVMPVTGLCGPCTFGEAETAGGNW